MDSCGQYPEVLYLGTDYILMMIDILTLSKICFAALATILGVLDFLKSKKCLRILSILFIIIAGVADYWCDVEVRKENVAQRVQDKKYYDSILSSNGLKVVTINNQPQIQISNSNTFIEKFTNYIQIPSKVLHDTVKIEIKERELNSLIEKHLMHRIDSVISITKAEKSKIKIYLTRMPDCKCKKFTDELIQFLKHSGFKDIGISYSIFPSIQMNMSALPQDNIAVMTAQDLNEIDIIVGS